MNKKSLTETDICMKYITPSLEKAGWDIHTQISREHYFTDGRIQVQGKLSTRGKGKKADYILSYGRDQMIAVIEAKDNNHSIGSGMQQAQEYADILDIPFVFTSNGDGYMFYDKTAQSGPLITELSLEEFPSPKTLWEKYLAFKGIGEESKPVIEQPLFFGEGSYRPRYYQQIAINRTVEAIASTAFAILNPIQECSPRHLYYTLRSPFYIEYVESFMKGVAYPAINDKNLLNGPIPVPPSEEQKAIVEVVNTLFKEVEQLETLTKKRIQLKESFVVSALNKLTEAKNTQQEWNFLQQHFSSFFTEKKNIKSLRETILQLAVQGKLTKGWRVNNPNTEPASELLKRIEAEKQQLIAKKKIKKEKTLPPVENDEMPYELPVGWKFTRLGSIIKISSGDGLTSTNMDKDGSIPVYGGNGITGYHSKFNVSKPEIVIGRVGYYCGSIHLTEEKAWVTDNAFVTKFSEQNIYRGYLVWLLKGTNLKENENATAQPVISGKKIYPIVIGFPPLEEQKAIVEKVNSLMALCDELEQQIETSNIQIEQLMQSCVAEALA